MSGKAVTVCLNTHCKKKALLAVNDWGLCVCVPWSVLHTKASQRSPNKTLTGFIVHTTTQAHNAEHLIMPSIYIHKHKLLCTV